MTFDRTQATIQAGDWVIIYHSRTSLTSEICTPGKEIQSRYGCFRHSDLEGKPWGTKLASTNNRGFVFLLKPTPELWTLALPHRTQILYLPDIAFITSHLDVKPGSQIIEAGTGSGSFTHSLARTVGPEGKVHSFEYHEERFGKARDEFKQHGIDDVVTVKHQNVYKDGFDGLEDTVDSVFLDLPAPWDALEHAKKAMRKDRQARICCFSPCIEQVIRTCSALAELGFSDITMFETLTRTHDPAQVTAPPISAAIDRIKQVEVKKEKRRESQIEDAKKKREEKKRKLEAAAASEGVESAETADGAQDNGHEAKKQKIEAEEDAKMEEDANVTLPWPPTAAGADIATSNSTSSATPVSAAPELSSSAPSPSHPTTPSTKPLAGPLNKEDREYTMKAGPYSRGHTSYLTFAVLLPLVPEEARAVEDEAVEVEEAEGKKKEDEAAGTVADGVGAEAAP
ncbi:hypothetical protein JCM11641_007167 [Rhodosporidiobolus odoratus]